MKHLMKLLFVPFLLFFSCTTQVDGVLNDGDLPQNNEDASVEATLHPVGISFSKSSIAAFAEEGISEIGIYVYMDGSLIYGEKQPLVHGAIEVPLPWEKTYRLLLWRMRMRWLMPISFPRLLSVRTIICKSRFTFLK